VNRQPKKFQVRTQKTIVNGAGVLLLIAYGWFCVKADVFYMGSRNGYDRSLHGGACHLMVGCLMCITALLLLDCLPLYLKPKQRIWCEKIWWPVAWIGLGFFTASLFFGWILIPGTER
jgi:hypothetical protein